MIASNAEQALAAQSWSPIFGGTVRKYMDALDVLRLLSHELHQEELAELLEA